ncbi:MAG: sulfotransferase family 2 domain-containing protein, partial [Pseudomonadota bacterium]
MFVAGRNEGKSMIISHRHKFIFQHSRKVAGSTITTLLNKHLGPEDLQIGSWHDSVAHGGGFNRHALKELVTNPIVVGEAVKRTATSVSNLRRPKFMHIANEALKKPYFAKLGPNPPHAEAWRVRDFAPDAWQTYFKFSFVRNPYAQEVSDFSWRKCPARGVAFEEFLKRKLDPQRPDPEGVSISPPTNWPIYAIGDEVAVDF